MFDYNEEKARRTAIFEHSLQLMVQRRLDEAEHGCAIIFNASPTEGAPAPKLSSRCVVLASARTAHDGAGGADFVGPNTEKVSTSNPQEDAQRARRSRRFIQFAFEDGAFYLELPNTTLWPDEANRLLSERPGFFHARDRRFAWHSVDYWDNMVKRWNPVHKHYLNSDTRAAAEDVAFTFYSLWQFSLDWQFYQRALVFGANCKRDWEGEEPLG